MASVLIIGATSDIARALAHVYAAHGHRLLLAARNAARLEKDAQDLRLRHGVEVSVHDCDVLETAQHAAFVEGLPLLPDVAICVAGLLGDAKRAEREIDHATLIMRSNYEGPACLLGELANRFETRGSGSLIGISSVAGERGRASNYVYGSAKAGFTAFLSGLRNRLAKKGVAVMTVKPGFVDTKMTAGMPLPPALTAQPQKVAQDIYRAWSKKRDVLYTKCVWAVIMGIIRAIPEPIFKRLSL